MTATAKKQDDPFALREHVDHELPQLNAILNNPDCMPDCAPYNFLAEQDHNQELRGMIQAGQLAVIEAKRELDALVAAKAHRQRTNADDRVADDPREMAASDRKISRAKGKYESATAKLGLDIARQFPFGRIESDLAKSSGVAFKACPIEVPREKGKTFAQQLDAERRAETALIAEKDSVLKSILPESDIRTQALKQLRDFAASGAPDFRAAGRMIRNDIQGDRRSQGKVKFAETHLSLDRRIPDAMAFVCWALLPDLEARFETEIAAMAQPDKALSLLDRKKLVADIDARLLLNHRRQVALVRAIRAEGGNAWHLRHISTLALLEIAPV